MLVSRLGEGGVEFLDAFVIQPERPADADLNEIRRVLTVWMPNRVANGILAQLLVNDVLEVAEEVQEALLVVEDEEMGTKDRCANPAHALITGMPISSVEQGSFAGLLAHDLLAMRVASEHVYPAALPS